MKLAIPVVVLVASLLCIHQTHALAVMSVDFGSEWMKVGIVSPGVPMEIALNKESKRKTPTIVSFRDNIRNFGEDAQTVGLRFPKNAYMYLLDLLGKSIDHPLVKLYQQRFPQYDIVANSERDGTILFKHDADTYYSPEELVAQFLVKAKEFAEQGAGQPIKECVLVVPGYFNQAERKAMLQAAQLANLKVLQLINDYVAVAMNYGIFRSKDFNETAQYMMFYDMGASSTTATLVSYQTVKTKERGYVETHPQLSVIGVGFDRTLGGLEIQLRLRDHLARKFNELNRTKTNVFDNPRAMAKLFKEAGRVKNVLSANADHYAQIEGLIDEQDMKVHVTRDDLEALIGDWFDRVGKPIEQALKTAHLTKDVLSQVVLVGAGTRVPKVQEILQKIVGQDLAKNLNTDEAAVMGAVYKAADLSTGFQVKKFLTKDAVIYPIQINFEREIDGGDIKQVKRTLFGLMNPYPQKKIITFNKHITDFTFKVNYADLEYLDSNEVSYVGQLNLTEIKLTGVAEALKKTLVGDQVESKGIKTHFAMDESGLLNLVNVELVVEKTVPADAADEEEGTLSKLGSTISKLFGGDDKTPEEPIKTVLEDDDDNEKQTEDQKQQQQKNTTTDKINDQKTTEKSNKTTTTKSSNNNSTTSEDTKQSKPKLVTIKERIEATESILTSKVLNDHQLEESLNKLMKLDQVEKELNRRATALNNLEGFVIDVQTKLEETPFIEASTPEEIAKIIKACSDVSEWLYEDGADADADVYEKKFDTVRGLTKDLFVRVWEHGERPEALGALNSLLNHSTHFLLTAKNLTKTTSIDKDVFTDSEVNALARLINETEQWKLKMIEEQNQLKLSDTVKLTVRSITDKMGALDREVKYLVNKIKLWRPKKPVVKEDVDDGTKSENVKASKDEDEGKVTSEDDDEADDDTVVESPDAVEEESIEPTASEQTSQDTHSEL